MNTANWVTSLNASIRFLLTGNSSEFYTFGLAVATGLGVILVVRYGITAALSGRGFDFGDFFQEVLLLIGTCLCMLKGYTTPMAIFGGETFPNLIIDGPAQLANQVSRNSDAAMEAMFLDLLNRNAPPVNPADISGLAGYWILKLFVQGTRGVMFAVTSFGLVAQAVVVLLGPVFIPFLLFRPMSFMFWGWFRCLLQYSFYPLVCACFSSVLSSFFLNLPLAVATGGMSIGQGLVLLPYFFVIIVGMLAAPMLVSSLFSGSSTSGPLSRFFS